MGDFIYNNTGKVLLGSMALLIGLLILAGYEDSKQKHANLTKAYAVFIRQTGNSNNVTFDEFSAMMRVQHPEPSPTFIPIIIPIR